MFHTRTSPELLNPFALPHGVKVTFVVFGVLDEIEVDVFFLCNAVRCHKSCRSASVSRPPQALRHKFRNVGCGAAAAAMSTTPSESRMAPMASFKSLANLGNSDSWTMVLLLLLCICCCFVGAGSFAAWLSGLELLRKLLCCNG